MIYSVDFPRGAWRVMFTHTMEWKDNRLKFNTTAHNSGCLPMDKVAYGAGTVSAIWTPPYYYSDQIDDFGTKTQTVELSYDGRVKLTTREGVESACSSDFKKMPFDSQTCSVRMQLALPLNLSYFSTPTNSAVPFSQASQNTGWASEWGITSLTTAAGTIESDTMGSYIDFSVTIARKSGYWVTFVLIPSIFLVVMSYGTFWIQRTAMPARATFAFICYLTVISLTNGALGVLPHLSAADAYLLAVLSASQFFTAYTVMTTVVANYLLHIEIRVGVALKAASDLADVGKPVHNIQEFVRQRCGRLGRTLIKRNGEMLFSDQHVDIVSRWFFPACYILSLSGITTMI
jgi:gamma-aminobutyric acid receptor subunit rho